MVIRQALAALAALVLSVVAAAAQGPTPVIGPGPGPTPSPWIYAAPNASLPAGNCVTLPSTVTGGCPSPGNAINVSNGYFVNGVSIAPVTGGANGQLLQGVTGNPPIWTGSATLSTLLIVPLVIGGNAANASLTLEASFNGFPSGEMINLESATVNVFSTHGGASNLIIGNGGTGAILQLYSLSGSGPQSIEGPSGATGVITLPQSGTQLAGLATNQTWTGNNTYNTPIIFTGGVNVPSASTGEVGGTAANGLTLIGNGTGFDVAVLARGGGSACGLAANTVIWECVITPGANNTSASFLLLNGNVASASNQQFSGSIDFAGQGWKTNATAASQQAEFEINEQPIQAAAAPVSTLVFSSQVNGGGFTPNVIMTDGTQYVSLSMAVGGAAVLASGQAGDLQVGRGNQQGFIFFGTAAGNSFFGLNGANTWLFGGSGSSASLGFGSNAAEAATILSSTAVSPSGDSLTLKASTLNMTSFSGAVTVNCGATGTVSCTFTLAGSASGAVSLIAQSAASGTVTLPNGATTLAGLATTQTFTLPQSFSSQLISVAARTIISATAATLDDVLAQAETTTISGNTGSPITALSKVHLQQPTLTDSSAVTVTTASTLTIDNAPAQAGSVTITNAYALNVVAGSTFLGGKVFMNGLTAGSGTKALCLNATANEVQTDTSATICGISALRYKNLIAEITPNQGLGILTLRGETYRYKPDAGQDAKIHVSLIADDMARLNHDCAEYSAKGVENYMDRCFEAYQVAYDKKLWEIIGNLTSRLPMNDSLRAEVETLRR